MPAEPPEDVGSTREVDAKVGDLSFVGDFSDPNVDVLNTRETSEHDIISGVSELGGDGDFVVQARGRQPTQITITGWIREDQLETADDLVATNMVGVRTGRWVGSAVVEDVDVDYSRVYHDYHGPIFETTIEILAVHRNQLPDGFSEPESMDEPPDDVGRTMEVSTVIGNLSFVDDFSDPDVNVTNSRQTQDHEIVTGHRAYRDEGMEYIVQAMGKNPADIDITGWIREDQLEVADMLVAQGQIRLISGRWTGTVVVTDVDVEYKRNYHEIHGPLFEVTVTALGVQKGVFPE